MSLWGKIIPSWRSSLLDMVRAPGFARFPGVSHTSASVGRERGWLDRWDNQPSWSWGKRTSAIGQRQRGGYREHWSFIRTSLGASVSGGDSEHRLQQWQPERAQDSKAPTPQEWWFGPLPPGKLAEFLAKCEGIQKWEKEKGNDELKTSLRLAESVATLTPSS